MTNLIKSIAKGAAIAAFSIVTLTTAQYGVQEYRQTQKEQQVEDLKKRIHAFGEEPKHVERLYGNNIRQQIIDGYQLDVHSTNFEKNYDAAMITLCHDNIDIGTCRDPNTLKAVDKKRLDEIVNNNETVPTFAMRAGAVVMRTAPKNYE